MDPMRGNDRGMVRVIPGDVTPMSPGGWAFRGSRGRHDPRDVSPRPCSAVQQRPIPKQVSLARGSVQRVPQHNSGGEVDATRTRHLSTQAGDIQPCLDAPIVQVEGRRESTMAQHRKHTIIVIHDVGDERGDASAAGIRG